MKLRLSLLLSLTLLTFTGCAVNDFRVSMGLLSPYNAAVEIFKQGEVMEARKQILAIPKDDEDYQQAQKFLKDKVEPARLKLLRYFARKGKREESKQRWAQAEEAYSTAAGLSKSPKALLQYQTKMSLEARKLRAQTIYTQRVEEDEIWISWYDHYNPPKGLLGDDKVFDRARGDLYESIEERAKRAWTLAQKYKMLDVPEMAWIYIDSYLRLKPGSKEAQDLKNAMSTAIPKNFGLTLSSSKKKSVLKRPSLVKAQVNKKDVKDLMKLEEWKKAQKGAQMLRRQGDPDADKLLETTQKKMANLALKAYTKGNLAFRLEQIDEAVMAWEEAVRWMPREQTYIDALRRGQHIQERLAALKSEESPAEKDVMIEE